MAGGSPTWATGRKSGVTTSAVVLTSVTQKSQKGVQIYADSNNTGIVFLGNHSGITADVADATDGFPLSAGESIYIPARTASDFYVIADTGTNKLWWVLI